MICSSSAIFIHYSKMPPQGWLNFAPRSVRLHFDFDVATGWQAQVHEAVDGFWRRLEHVDQALMSTHFELFAAFLIDVRALYDGESCLACRQRDWTCERC